MVFEAMARKHWRKYLPELTAALKQAGTFEATIKRAANAAREEFAVLVQSGAQTMAAREIVLKEHILLPPEADEY